MRRPPTPLRTTSQPKASPTRRPTEAPAPSFTPTALTSANASPSARPTLPPVPPGLITHGDRSSHRVALTFDACQAPNQTPSRCGGYDEAIIKALVETGTPATLFLGGLWMESHASETRALAANPLFELGNHSWSHRNLATLSPEEIDAEITRAQDLGYRLTGRKMSLFRLPFGTYSDEALAVIARRGLRTIQWDVVTGDPDPDASAERILQAVTGEAQNGSIIIMHMNDRGWHTAEALPHVIAYLRAQGYTLVTVSQLLGTSVGSPDK